MEKDRREHIRNHLHELITYTICDKRLLNFCHQKGVLGLSDIDDIATIIKHTEKADKFYQIIRTRTNSYQVLIEALRLSDQGGIVEILETGVVPPTLTELSRVRQILDDENKVIAHKPSGPIFDVSPPVDLFTGRRSELDELHQKVKRSLVGGNGQPIVISQVTSISGLGGIGKTQLSRQYVHENRQHFDDNCLWLNAETENTLWESFRILAKDRLGITTKDANGTEKKIQTIVGDVYRFFHERKCLLVFDNAENAPWLKQFLPLTSSPTGPGQYRPCILITSRTREWDKGIEVVDLNELEQCDAVAMVKMGLRLDGDASQDGTINRLVKRLQCFPLAIQQAISYVNNQQQVKDYSVLAYLEEFEKRGGELLSFAETNIEFLNDYTKTTLTTWTMTAEKIGQDANFGGVALHILYAMAYLSPEKIERKMLLDLPHVSKNENILFEGVRLLVRFSMIKGDDKQRLLSIHQLVQEVTRMELVAKNEEANTVERVLSMLGGNGLTLPQQSLDHLPTIWRHARKYPELHVRFGRLAVTTIQTLLDVGRNAEAVGFGVEAHCSNDVGYIAIRGQIYLADALTRRGRGNDLEVASTILMEQRAIIVEKGWHKLVFFKNGLCKEIERIEIDIASPKPVFSCCIQ